MAFNDRYLFKTFLPNHSIIITLFFLSEIANCTLRLNIKNCFSRVGLTNLKDELSSSDMKGLRNLYDFSEAYVHPSYNPSYGSEVKDIGLIKVRGPIRFERKEVEPACVDLTSFKAFDKEKFQVTAWNSRMERDSYTNMLQSEVFQAASNNNRREERNYIFAFGLNTFGLDNFFGEPGKIFGP